MFTRLAHIASVPLAALMRLLRASAERHPMVYALTPHEDHTQRPY